MRPVHWLDDSRSGPDGPLTIHADLLSCWASHSFISCWSRRAMKWCWGPSFPLWALAESLTRDASSASHAAAWTSLWWCVKWHKQFAWAAVFGILTAPAGEHQDKETENRRLIPKTFPLASPKWYSGFEFDEWPLCIFKNVFSCSCRLVDVFARTSSLAHSFLTRRDPFLLWGLIYMIHWFLIWLVYTSKGIAKLTSRNPVPE